MKWTPILLGILVLFSCDNENHAPLCSITEPANGEEIEHGHLITISVSAEDPDGTTPEVDFFIDDEKIGNASAAPFNITWDTNNEELGNHTIKVEAKDDLGDTTTHEISVLVVHKFPLPTVGTMDDVNGNRYSTAQIGSQTWMAENLRTTHYSDGTPIPLITDQNEWEKLGDNDIDKAYCWYNHDSLTYSQKYGALYTFAAAVNGTPQFDDTHVQGVCPDGWHVPSQTDWFVLERYIKEHGYYFEVGTLLKSKEGWYNSDGIPAGNGRDVFLFGGTPGGQRNWREESAFTDEGVIGLWWQSMEDPRSSHQVGQACGLMSYDSNLGDFYVAKSGGISVRCIKD